MSCDCGCTSTTVDCNCPDPTGIEAAKIQNIISATFGAGEDIYNGGNGYTYTIYTNTSSGSQIVYVQNNMQISCTGTHDISSAYQINAGSPTYSQYEDDAPTKTDYTHFFTALTLAPSDVLKLVVKSSDVNGKLIWLQSFIYKYDI